MTIQNFPFGEKDIPTDIITISPRESPELFCPRILGYAIYRDTRDFILLAMIVMLFMQSFVLSTIDGQQQAERNSEGSFYIKKMKRARHELAATSFLFLLDIVVERA